MTVPWYAPPIPAARGSELFVITSYSIHYTKLYDGIYANPREQGVLWERPVSAEMIYPDGTEGFQINCGLRIQGNGSRGPASTPKHSLRLLFKGIYGPRITSYNVCYTKLLRSPLQNES